MSSAIWITGLSASGKSALARAAAAQLVAANDPVVVLELDEIRAVVTPSPAARWHLGSSPSSRPSEHPAPAPDVAFGYEGSLDPELTFHTDTGDLAGNMEALLRLAQRLQHAAAAWGGAPARSIAD